MADSRELTYGLSLELDSAIGNLQQTADSLRSITAGLQGAESDSDSLSDALRGAGRAGEQAGSRIMGGLEDAGRVGDGIGDDIASQFHRMGEEAESFGSAVRSSMSTSAKQTDSLSGSIKAGFQGAFGYADKQVGSFTNRAKAGFAAVGNAVKHPVQTIKGALMDALRGAGDATEDVGDSADDTEDKLDDVGSTGSGAGNAIRDSFKEAVKAIVGIEAIKAGIGLLKDFIGAAMETAGAVETIGAKFDASFGTQAGEVSVWADNFAGAVHRSENEVKDFLTSSQAMYKGLGTTGEAAAELSQITTSLGYDIGAAFKMDDAEAVGALQDAIKGNGEALAGFGFQLDDATLKQQALKMGIVGELDSLDDAALAQIRLNAIMEQAGDIQKSAIDGNTGLVNSTKGLKAIATDFMAAAGGKFTPVIEKLFGSISEAWPTIEPMLMNFVGILSEGMGEAIPVLLDLGQTLIPTLASVLGTLFEAGAPLISVFGSLAETVLPPLAGILGTLGETLIPPLVGILGTLNTSVIQPLMPAFQKIAEAILPPIAKLLGIISPILEIVSPILMVIGEYLGEMGETLGVLIGWLSDGVGAVTNFFSALFGGASKGAGEIDGLTGAMSSLGSTGAEPISVGMPHNAKGTDNFAGGWTHINEEGGEAAFLPKGTAILPADETSSLIGRAIDRDDPDDSPESFAGGGGIKIEITVPVTVEGNADDSVIERMQQELKQFFESTVKKAVEEALQEQRLKLTRQNAF